MAVGSWLTVVSCHLAVVSSRWLLSSTCSQGSGYRMAARGLGRISRFVKESGSKGFTRLQQHEISTWCKKYKMLHQQKVKTTSPLASLTLLDLHQPVSQQHLVEPPGGGHPLLHRPQLRAIHWEGGDGHLLLTHPSQQGQINYCRRKWRRKWRLNMRWRWCTWPVSFEVSGSFSVPQAPPIAGTGQTCRPNWWLPCFQQPKAR